jgi:hypothetical protein
VFRSARQLALLGLLGLAACSGSSTADRSAPTTPTTKARHHGPGPLELGRWVCGPGVMRISCAGPVDVGPRYFYVLRTHCGIRDAYFGGRLWRARPPLTDGSGNPPHAWVRENPESLGTMRLIRRDLAVFETKRAKLVARFVPAPRGWKVTVCE